MFATQAEAQRMTSSYGTTTTKSQLPMTQQEKDAVDDEVAFSSDQIIELLKNEPGLDLEVKKALVRKAYEQGRLLDPKDLEDEVLFNLIKKDFNVRVVATQEIENRGYIRAKPIQAELERQQLLGYPQIYPAPSIKPGAGSQASGLQTNGSQANGLQPNAPSQEQRYWAQREQQQELQRRRQQQLEQQQQQEDQQQQQPQVIPPQQIINRASLSSTDSSGGLTPMTADELPSVLAGTDSPGQSSSEDKADIRSRGSRTDETSSSLLPDLSSSPYDYQAEPAMIARSAPPKRPLASSELMQPNDHPVVQHRPNPYGDIPSLYDLYSQVSPRPAKLERFGAAIFRNGTGNFDQLPMDAPVGPDYVLGPGDGVTIEVWGGTARHLRRVVDPEGRLALPEVGTVEVAGKTLGAVQKEVQAVLRTQFRDVDADVSLSGLRSVRVYVVGDVKMPGAYDVSSLATPLNALYLAGGPTDNGSLRIVRHYRGKQLLQEVDLYDLILHGVNADLLHLQPGDTILVPPAGPQVTLEGMVRRPGIYELNNETSLAQVLQLAGGVLPSGTLRHIDVERLEAHQDRRMLSLDIPQSDQSDVTVALENFKIQPEDKIRISPILAYSEKTIYLDGHVFHPGKYPYADGMKITDLIKSYTDLLPEPSQRYAEVIRLDAPDFRPEVISFNLAEAMKGGADDLKLQPFDTVRIFGRFDFEGAPAVLITGEVRNPGEHRTNGETHLRDAVFLAGGLTQDADLGDAQVYRKLEGGQMKVFSVNLGKALQGDEVNNILLQPLDRLMIQRSLAKTDPPTVTIDGEVARPGKYPLGKGMTASDLIHLAGGLKRGAYLSSADLSRYVIENGKKVESEHFPVELGKALSGDSQANVALRDGDLLSVRQITGWDDIGAAITVTGEVAHPGTFGIVAGEKLSSVLARAGGFRSDAYPYGAVLERVQVYEMAERSRLELVRRLEAGSNIHITGAATGPEQVSLTQAAMAQQQTVVNNLKTQKASGRLVIHITSDVAAWQNTAADIQVRAGDTLFIPKRPNFVLVNGQVYNNTAITYIPGKTASWYLNAAGGPTQTANTKDIFIVRANGSLIGRSQNGWWGGNVLSTKLEPGDSVIVPEKFLTGSSFMRSLMAWATVVSSFSLTAAAVHSF
jgi:protein involved in polysaccharide export with SLBB domain